MVILRLLVQIWLKGVSFHDELFPLVTESLSDRLLSFSNHTSLNVEGLTI